MDTIKKVMQVLKNIIGHGLSLFIILMGIISFQELSIGSGILLFLSGIFCNPFWGKFRRFQVIK